MTALRTCRPGLPNIHVAVISSDMGAGDGSVAGCDSTGGKNGIFQYTARGTCTATGLEAGATYISDIAGASELHRQPRGRVHLHRGARRERLRLRAPVRLHRCARSAPTAAPRPPENQGFLRPDAYLAIIMITNEDDCSASPGVPLFDTGSQHEPRVAARAARELPLQRVRPHVRRRDARRTATRRTRTWPPTVSYTKLRVERQPRATCSASATPRTGSRRSRPIRQPDHRRGDHRPGDALHRELEGAEHGRHVVRRGLLPVAGDRALVHGADGSFADPGVRVTEFVQPVRRQRPDAADLRPELRAVARLRIAELIDASLEPPCITGAGRQQAGHAASPTARSSATPANGTGGIIDTTVAVVHGRTAARGPAGSSSPAHELRRRPDRGRLDRSEPPDADHARTRPSTARCAIPSVPDPDRGCP